MDTHSDSFLEFLDPAGPRIHVRYLGREGEAGTEGANGGDADLAAHDRRSRHQGTSIVVIRQPYAFLAPAIRSMFEGAEDVQVLVDRRQRARRRRSIPVRTDRREEARDRRESFPILDVIIDLDS